MAEHQVEMSDEGTARAIYMAHFGHLDDKFFEASKTQEISWWLQEGCGVWTLEDLIDAWAEYDAEEIERQGGE